MNERVLFCNPKTKGFMQFLAYLAVDVAVAHLQAEEMTRPGVSAAHKFDHTPEIPLARAFQKMHCLKERHDWVMIHRAT